MIAPKHYTLSSHAREQVEARTEINPSELPELLTAAGVATRSDPAGDMENIVFWSAKDEWPFIAITNRITGDVLTVIEAVHRSISINAAKWTDPRAILTDGKPKSQCEWASTARWANIACAIRKAGCPVPEWIGDYLNQEMVAQREEDAEEKRRAELRRQEAVEGSGRYLTHLRVLFADGGTLNCHGRDARAEIRREWLLSGTVNIYHGSVLAACRDLVERMMRNGRSVNDIDAITLEVRAFDGSNYRNPQKGSVLWAEPVMAMGIPGARFTRVLAEAVRQVPDGEAVLEAAA